MMTYSTGLPSSDGICVAWNRPDRIVLEHEPHAHARDALEPAARRIPAQRAHAQERDRLAILVSLHAELDLSGRLNARAAIELRIRCGALDRPQARLRPDRAREEDALGERGGLDRDHLEVLNPLSVRKLDTLLDPGQVGPAGAVFGLCPPHARDRPVALAPERDRIGAE